MTADEIKAHFLRRVMEWERTRMAEPNGKIILELRFNGIRIEGKSDGALILYVPPNEFRAITEAGCSDSRPLDQGNTGTKFTKVIIAPFFAQGTASIPGHSNPTEMTR